MKCSMPNYLPAIPSKPNAPIYPTSLNSSFSSSVSPYRAEIDLQQPIYNPGQKVEGSVKLVLDKRLNCDLLTVRLYGSARVFFTELSVSLILLILVDR